MDSLLCFGGRTGLESRFTKIFDFIRKSWSLEKLRKS